MSDELYRLAVIQKNDEKMAVVEQGGTMVPLHVLLGNELLPTPLHDLMPLLDNWNHFSGPLNDAVSAKSALFDESNIEASKANFLVPLAQPGNLICIGANYHDHVAEMPVPMTPAYPYSFLKPVRNTLRATGDPVVAPRFVEKMDWEAEIAAVIGQTCKDVSVEQALDYVCGYMNFNDLSARDWIENRPPIGIDWTRHKAHDGFAPLGPYLVPTQFVPDPQDLPITLSVNEVVKQNSTTGQMIFGVAEIVAHLSEIMTLHPGDVIATGTPAGVGHGRQPPEYLHPGDIIEMEIGILGKLVTPIV